jgi:hypothetical protein
MEFIEIDFEKEINKINPVTWIYNNDPLKNINIGYIAEDLNEIDAFKYLIQHDDAGNIIGIKYELLSIYAIEALKVAYKKIEALEDKIKSIK